MMNETAIRLLRCPVCRGRLTPTAEFDSSDAALTCADCRRPYPVRDGLPHLSVGGSPADVAASFGFQWRARAWRLFEGDTLYGLSADDESRNFFNALGIGPEKLAGKVVLDAGCGDGFLLTVLAQHPTEVVGIDLSASANLAAKRCSHLSNVTVLHGDLFSPPFPPGSFDYVWCEGVLVHTENPRRGFQILADLVKPGGRLYVWVYPSENLSVYQRLRDLLRGAYRLPHSLLLLLCYFLAIPLTLAQRLRKGPREAHRFRTVAFGLFDNLSPRVQTRHTADEIRRWFQENGFTDVRQTGVIGMSGTRNGLD